MSKIEKIMENMSLEDKISQTAVILMQKGVKAKCKPGAAFFFGQIITEADEAGIDELRGYVKELVDDSKINPLITTDFENGCGSMVRKLTPFPYLMGLGATRNKEIAYNYGKATALEAKLVGANWSLSPVSDLNINERNPLVNVRSIGDDPAIAEELLPEIIRGMQENGLSACSKHFPGDGTDYRDQHLVTSVNSLSMEEWWENYGRVYKAVIAGGVNSIMLGHISLPSYTGGDDGRLPATLSHKLITGLLKGELDFDGIVVTDALNMGGFAGWYNTHEESEIEALKAGCDMLLWPSENYISNALKAVKNGYISLERIDDAVRRILSVKEKMGLLDDNYNYFADLSDGDKKFIKSVQLACSNESITLIKNEVGMLPFDKNKIKNIGIIPVVEHEPAMEEARSLKFFYEQRGFNVSFYEGADKFDRVMDEFYEKNDVVIYACFSRPFRPIGFIDYTGARAWQIVHCFKPKDAVRKNVIASFGSPYFGNQYFEKAKTYVNAYSMLSCSAEAFVKATCGEIDFKGKSPVKL